MNSHEKLTYVEFAARDLTATKDFFSKVFGWQFSDFGNDYSSFANQGLNGGFYRADACSQPQTGGALLVFYSANIQATLDKVVEHGGKIVKPIFTFPGGCRFHFVEPSGNELAVWSEKQ